MSGKEEPAYIRNGKAHNIPRKIEGARLDDYHEWLGIYINTPHHKDCDNCFETPFHDCARCCGIYIDSYSQAIADTVRRKYQQEPSNIGIERLAIEDALNAIPWDYDL